MSGKPRELSIDASVGDDELNWRQVELKAWLETELQGSSSLNARGTTLAALVGATIALVAGFASTWLDPEWGLSDGVEVFLTVLLAIALLALGLSGLFAFFAVYPVSKWRGQLEEIVPTLAGNVEADRHKQVRRYAQLTLETLELQRTRNDRKARHMRISLVLLIAGVAAVLIQALAFAIAAQGSEAWCDRCSTIGVFESDLAPESPSDGARDSTPEGIEHLDAVARRFAPVVWIHRREKFGPVSVEEFLEHSELTWRTASRFRRDSDLAGRGALDPARLGFGCAALTASCYRHDRFMATDLTRPHHESSSRPLDLTTKEGFYLDPDDPVRRGEIGSSAQAPMYYEARTGETTRIAYWFFFGYSRPNKTFAGVNPAALFSHEGDWENIEVVVGPGGRPRAVRYFGHGDPRRFSWDAICKIVEEGEEECGTGELGRPVVYSALYSHASYASAAERRSEETKVCAKNRLKWPCSHDFRNQGFLWDPLASAGGLHDVRAQPWYGFGGAWGSAGSNADTTGPLGPSQYKLPSDPEPGELESVIPEQPPSA
jgi:hypothetical protein